MTGNYQVRRFEHPQKKYLDEISPTQYRHFGNALIRRSLLEHTVDGRNFYEEVLHGLDLDGSETILDVGCGSGRDLVDLATQHNHTGPLIGLETPSSDDYVRPYDLGMLLAERLGVANLDFIDGYAQAIPLDASSVDRILQFSTFYHYPDLGAALSEVVRVSKPGGELVAITNGQDNKLNLHRFRQRMGEYLGVNAPPVFSAALNLDRAREVLAQEAGIVPQKEIYQRTEKVITTADDYIDYMYAIDSYRPSYSPAVTTPQWLAARHEVVEKEILAALAETGEYREPIERGALFFKIEK